MTTNAVAADPRSPGLRLHRKQLGRATSEAITASVAPVIPQAADASSAFAHLNPSHRTGCENFGRQLEPQLAAATPPSSVGGPPRPGYRACYDEQMGARPMARVIQDTSRTLATKLLFVTSRAAAMSASAGSDEAADGKTNRLSSSSRTGHADAGKVARRPAMRKPEPGRAPTVAGGPRDLPQMARWYTALIVG